MNKKIKGYEVMKLIAEKKIKEGQVFLFTSADGDIEEKICWCGDNFRCIDSERNFLLDSIGDIDFATGDFEIIEDEKEIDINDIEELVGNVNVRMNNKTVDAEDLFYTISNIIVSLGNSKDKINQLVKAVKQLDKKINKED